MSHINFVPEYDESTYRLNVDLEIEESDSEKVKNLTRAAFSLAEKLMDSPLIEHKVGSVEDLGCTILIQDDDPDEYDAVGDLCHEHDENMVHINLSTNNDHRAIGGLATYSFAIASATYNGLMNYTES